MNKKLFLGIAFTLAVLFLFSCSALDKESGYVPCSFCEDESRASYGYCFYNNQCIYMSQYNCDNSYGSFYTSQSSCNNNNFGYIRSSSSSLGSSPDLFIGSSSSSSITIIKRTFTDYRDYKTYEYTDIGSQRWMAQNLNYNGGSSSSVGSCYDNSEKNCDTYGRLFDWATAMALDATYNSSSWGSAITGYQGICPYGWHIPSRMDNANELC
jgi:hypothetical protein